MLRGADQGSRPARGDDGRADAADKSDEAHERLSQPIAAILQRAQRPGEVRDDVTVTDLGCILTMLCEVSDLAGDTAPELWRRYLEPLLAGLRPHAPALPGVALTDQEFRTAYESHHKLRARAASPASGIGDDRVRTEEAFVGRQRGDVR